MPGVREFGEDDATYGWPERVPFDGKTLGSERARSVAASAAARRQSAGWPLLREAWFAFAADVGPGPCFGKAA